jgi:hypothetical protein
MQEAGPPWISSNFDLRGWWLAKVSRLLEAGELSSWLARLPIVKNYSDIRGK